MNSEYVINSIYNPKKKAKESFVFPKIAKPESTPPESKVFGRSSRKYNQQNIFKVDDEKKKLKLKIEEDRFKDIKSRETEELEVKLAELTRRHHEEMRELEEVRPHLDRPKSGCSGRSRTRRRTATRSSSASGNSKIKSWISIVFARKRKRSTSASPIW